MVKKQRTLLHAKEFYDKIIEGKCSCGEPVHKVTGSSINTFNDGTRYHHPNDNTGWGLLRCKKCKGLIIDTFLNN